MRMRIGRLAVPLVAAMALAACGDDSPLDRLAEAKESVDNAKSVASAFAGMADAAQQMAADAEAGVTTEPVDFRKLRDILPEELANLPRTETAGQKNGAMGFSVSNAQATYVEEAPDGFNGSLRQIEVTVTDLGSVRGMAMMGFAPWMSLTVDRETSDGYERTLEYHGYPAHREFTGNGQDRQQMEGTIQVLVAGRFLVQVEGDAIEDDRIEQALDGIDLDELAAMKDVGVTKAEVE